MLNSTERNKAITEIDKNLNWTLFPNEILIKASIDLQALEEQFLTIIFV